MDQDQPIAPDPDLGDAWPAAEADSTAHATDGDFSNASSVEESDAAPKSTADADGTRDTAEAAALDSAAEPTSAAEMADAEPAVVDVPTGLEAADDVPAADGWGDVVDEGEAIQGESDGEEFARIIMGDDERIDIETLAQAQLESRNASVATEEAAGVAARGDETGAGIAGDVIATRGGTKSAEDAVDGIAVEAGAGEGRIATGATQDGERVATGATQDGTADVREPKSAVREEETDGGARTGTARTDPRPYTIAATSSDPATPGAGGHADGVDESRTSTGAQEGNGHKVLEDVVAGPGSAEPGRSGSVVPAESGWVPMDNEAGDGGAEIQPVAASVPHTAGDVGNDTSAVDTLANGYDSMPAGASTAPSAVSGTADEGAVESAANATAPPSAGAPESALASAVGAIETAPNSAGAEQTTPPSAGTLATPQTAGSVGLSGESLTSYMPLADGPDPGTGTAGAMTGGVDTPFAHHGSGDGDGEHGAKVIQRKSIVPEGLEDMNGEEHHAAAVKIQGVWRRKKDGRRVVEEQDEEEVAEVAEVEKAAVRAAAAAARPGKESTVPPSEGDGHYREGVEGRPTTRGLENGLQDEPETESEPEAVIEKLTRDQLISDISTWYHKKYVGGFRHKETGVEYFNASSQTPTPQEIKAAKAAPKFHRDTQTKFIRNRRTQTTSEAFTQMSRPDLHVSSEDDYVLKARRYFTSEEYEQLVIRSTTRIQCFVRQCFAIRLVRKLRQERDDRLKALAAKEKRRRELAERRRRKEIESRLHPKTTKDFEILYNGLENWRIQETEKINGAAYSEPARLAALADLLDQEAALIQKIDRLKLAANDENRERSIVRLLEHMAAPKKWPSKKLGFCLVDTPNTIRARELRDLYHALNVAKLTVDERLQILLHVKYTVKEFDCNLTREIVELIDREGDLVSRGRDEKSLEGLRRRVGNLFLQFIQTPEFNPEAAHHQKVLYLDWERMLTVSKFPDAGQAWKRDQAVYYCRSCTKYLPSTEFYLSTTMKHLGRCKNCTMKDNIANHRQDDSIFADMLRVIRAQEANRHAHTGQPQDIHYNALALLQESDMRHLVDGIWNRQSCIGGSRNVEELMLTRWEPGMELSPWNCVLLTRAEADTHDQQGDPNELYTDDFIRKIRQKHVAARRHFAQLPAMERYLKKHYAEDREGRM
ncbi:hypothetical protein HK101_006179, partial [Irineochytrium annulatum]